MVVSRLTVKAILLLPTVATEYKLSATVTRMSAPSAAQEPGLASSRPPLASRSMASDILLWLNVASIACKCFATAIWPMFAPWAAMAQAKGNSTAPMAASPSTATGASSWPTPTTIACKFSNELLPLLPPHMLSLLLPFSACLRLRNWPFFVHQQLSNLLDA
jgi:hypothetical protein